MSGFRIKPGREASVLTAVIAAVMGIFGLVVLGPAFASGPSFGPAGNVASGFLAVWVLGAFGIAAFYAYNAFSARGASLIDVELPEDVSASVVDSTRWTPAPETEAETDFEGRLRSLEALRRDGLITDAEYESKRAAILDERW